MRIKLDENIPASAVPVLSLLGHDVDTVLDEGLAGQDDRAVGNASQQAGRFLITQDLNFSDLRRFAPGTHHGLLLIRLRAPSRSCLTAKIAQLFRTEPVETWVRCFVVATNRKIRVPRPR